MPKFIVIDSFKVETRYSHVKLAPGWWFVFDGVGFHQSDLPLKGKVVEILRPDGTSLRSEVNLSALNPSGSIAVQFVNLSNEEVPRLSVVIVAK